MWGLGNQEVEKMNLGSVQSSAYLPLDTLSLLWNLMDITDELHNMSRHGQIAFH